MAVVFSLRWAELTPQQYDAVRKAVRWEEDVPEGAILHASWSPALGGARSHRRRLRSARAQAVAKARVSLRA